MGGRLPMAKQKHQEERWLTAREATVTLKQNSGRDDIPDSYIRSLARLGKVETKELDGRTVLYRAQDIEHYQVHRRDQGKGTGKKTKQSAEITSNGITG